MQKGSRSYALARSANERQWAAVCGGSALFILYAALLPFEFVTDPRHIQAGWESAVRWSWREFGDLSRADVVQNLLLFFPFGFTAAGTLALSSSRRMAVAASVATGCGLSVLCELLQLLTANRTSSAWDVLANAAGTFMGAAAVGAWPLARHVVAPAYAAVSRSPSAAPLVWTTVLILIAAWEPFDVTLDVGTVWSNLKALLTGETWQPITDELVTALRFSILSMLLARVIADLRRTPMPARLFAFGASMLFAIALESTQLLIASHAASPQDVIAAAGGSLAGVGIARVANGVRYRAATVGVVTFVAAIPYYLEPFAFAPVHRPIALVPFLAYYQFTTLQTLSHAVELVLLYAPVGFAIQWPRQAPRLMLRAGGLCAGAAFVLEYAQGWIVGRFPDVTDVGMAALGGVIGAMVASHAASHRQLT